MVPRSTDPLVAAPAKNLWYLGPAGGSTPQWWRAERAKHEARVRLLRYREWVGAQAARGLAPRPEWGLARLAAGSAPRPEQPTSAGAADSDGDGDCSDQTDSDSESDGEDSLGVGSARMEGQAAAGGRDPGPAEGLTAAQLQAFIGGQGRAPTARASRPPPVTPRHLQRCKPDPRLSRDVASASYDVARRSVSAWPCWGLYVT